MDEPLVDAEGFPRADVDVYAVRTARRDIIRLRNDHKHLSECIHRALVDVYQTGSPEASSNPPTNDHSVLAQLKRRGTHDSELKSCFTMRLNRSLKHSL